MPTVLVVEDDRDIRDVLRRYLERAHHAVLTTGGGAEALQLLAVGQVDLVLLDLGLPDIDGTDVLLAARAAQPPVPVVVLSARSTLPDRISGLTLGADDYVTKPFSPAEVVLRVGAVLSRASGAQAPQVRPTFGGGRLQIDTGAHQAWLDDVALDLTATEWGVLTTLSGTPGRVFSRLELINRVRGYEFSGYERSIDSHVKNLRHKLGPDGATIVTTVIGVGYRLGWSRDQ
ncbi:MAG TPA: response regulator transcription factor [Actinotalea sp.]|nr:response regulator transcription factor [Actinotalea sp.]